MIIYFIRHGIAESFAESDFNRELTTEGILKLREDFEKFSKEFKEDDYVIYSSPLVRAEQTAQILSEFLKKEYTIKDYLKGIRFNNLLEELRAEKHNCYILVSHEPYLSDYLYRITGKYRPVSRGSIHRVEI